jgi:hypothetical protein
MEENAKFVGGLILSLNGLLELANGGKRLKYVKLALKSRIVVRLVCWISNTVGRGLSYSFNHFQSYSNTRLYIARYSYKRA